MIGSEVTVQTSGNEKMPIGGGTHLRCARKFVMNKIYFAILYKDYTDVAQTEGDPAMQ